LQEPDKYVPSYTEYHTPADYNIQKSDELNIRVITLDPESQKIFNTSSSSSNSSLSSSYRGLYTYTVYDDGTIDFKTIGFYEYVGKENHAGFKYGINLDSIKRKIDSNQIVTKMIVKDNANEFAKNGFCSIARAPSNPGGT
jgi:protein involved in polysaccharide export with SLBB domain